MKKQLTLSQHRATVEVNSEREVFVRFENGQIFGIHLDDLDTLHQAAHELDPKALVLYRLEQTCGMHPTQWEAKDAEGHPLLIHFRHNRLSVYRYDDESLEKNTRIFLKQDVTIDPEAGAMETTDMLAITGYTVASYAE